MIYFTKDYSQFFSELEKNNNKEWFHSNQKRYETDVKKPMQRFLTDLVAELQKYDLEIDVDPKKCIGRINRDVRFSKDKTPYNVKVFAHIYKGRKEEPVPVIAFQIGATEMGIMSGYYNPSQEKINSIRDKIKSETATFKKIYSDQSFVSKFGTICGESLKRIPNDYKETFEKEPLVANNQFYYVKKLSADLILTDNLLPVIIEHYKAAKPLNDFLL
jgi:uncharacterized protein (TIGR02453 family)